MARQSLGQWAAKEAVNFDLSPIAQGSPAFTASEAASALSARPAFAVDHAPALETNDLFVEGSFGEAVPDTPTEAVLAIGQRIASETLGITKDGENLRVKAFGSSLLGSHLVAEQTVENLPVYGSTVNIHLDAERRPYCLTGRPFPEALGAALTAPSAGALPDAVEIVGDHLGTPLDAVRTTEVAVLVDNAFVRCTQVQAQTLSPFGGWNALVSADGDLLAIYNIASSQHGEARAFAVNPFRGNAVRVRLDNLTVPAELRGRFAEVVGPQGAATAGPQGAYFYDETDARFDEPALYYFLDRVRSAFEAQFAIPVGGDTFFASGENFNPMRATVHFDEALNNAFYDPVTRQLYFGDIEADDGGFRYTSRSREIVIHEFGHAISDSVCRLGRTTQHTQSRAMSEGYSDYFASTMLESPVMGDYFIDDAAGFRTTANDNKFPQGFAGEEHDVGEVWAGLLWSIRENPDVGAGVADALVMESLYFLGPWRTITQGLEALVLADRRLFPSDQTGAQGRHEGAINAAFDARKP